MWDSFLSNFYASPVRMDGVDYPTVEHAYQAAKVHRSLREPFRVAKGPGAAKRLGRSVTLPSWWDTKKEDIMLGLLRQKFAPGTKLSQLLLATGAAHLEEANTWGDRYWGTVNGVGRNRMGVLLMWIRSELDEYHPDLEPPRESTNPKEGN